MNWNNFGLKSRRLISIVSLVGLLAVMVVIFQNCGGFAANVTAQNASQSLGEPSSSTSGGSGPGGATTAGTGTGTATGTATAPAPTPALTESYFYVGAPDKIATFKIDRATDQVTRLADVAVTGHTPGFFGYDATQNRVFVSDGLGPMMSTFLFAPTTGALSAESVFPLINDVIHFSIYPSSTGYLLYAASFDDAMAAGYQIATPVKAATQTTEITFATTAETHAITANRSRNLVFVSNLAESLIHIYNDSSGSLVQIGTFPVTDPRTIMYDPIYDRVYLTTQNPTTASQVLIFNIVQVGGVYTLSQVGSYSMGLNGSDLKIDHSHGIVAASVRDPGKQGVWVLPVDKTGLFDATRADVFLPIIEVEARSLQISADGRYYAVSCNDPSNTIDQIIYELTYDATNAVASSKIISTQLVGPTNVLANFWIDVSQ